MIKYYWMNQAPGHGLVKLMEQDEIEALGASLRKIDQRLLTQDKDEGTTRIWYQGGEPYFDVFVELHHGKICWFQFTLRGKSISWNPRASSWQTGRTNELGTEDINFYPASKLIEGDRQTDNAFLELAYSILQTRSGEEIFDQVLALFDAQD
ncbi:hypothetical protein [Lyngbya aestuarii]|uniref:hypothetical protein n=1 Tax=Lyngbya aestuarii TaxID=118322 RepID=UPI00403E3632